MAILVLPVFTVFIRTRGQCIRLAQVAHEAGFRKHVVHLSVTIAMLGISPPHLNLRSARPVLVVNILIRAEKRVVTCGLSPIAQLVHDLSQGVTSMIRCALHVMKASSSHAMNPRPVIVQRALQAFFKTSRCSRRVAHVESVASKMRVPAHPAAHVLTGGSKIQLLKLFVGPGALIRARKDIFLHLEPGQETAIVPELAASVPLRLIAHFVPVAPNAQPVASSVKSEHSGSMKLCALLVLKEDFRMMPALLRVKMNQTIQVAVQDFSSLHRMLLTIGCAPSVHKEHSKIKRRPQLRCARCGRPRAQHVQVVTPSPVEARSRTASVYRASEAGLARNLQELRRASTVQLATFLPTFRRRRAASVMLGGLVWEGNLRALRAMLAGLVRLTKAQCAQTAQQGSFSWLNMPRAVSTSRFRVAV